MTQFFCAQAAREAGEDPIGSATPYNTYVLIECHAPWAADAFASLAIPETLRRFIQDTKRTRSAVQFLLVSRGYRPRFGATTVLIYDRPSTGWLSGYRGYEFQVQGLEDVADCVQRYWTQDVALHRHRIRKRDLLVCTHGSRDKCCAKYGLSFFRQAAEQLKQEKRAGVRLWRTSHIGGHRFAPTLIDLPDGRYYARLDLALLRSLLDRSGRITCMNRMYRGWGLLPAPLQVLERELLLRHGWDWFNYRITAQLREEKPLQALPENISETVLVKASGRIPLPPRGIREAAPPSFVGTLSVEQPNGTRHVYQARLVTDPQRSVCVKGSCGAAHPSTFTKYAVADLTRGIESPQVGLSA